MKPDPLRCWYCGRKRVGALFNIEHQTPVSRGGKNDSRNKVLACASCNARKGSRTVEEFRRTTFRFYGETGFVPWVPWEDEERHDVERIYRRAEKIIDAMIGAGYSIHRIHRSFKGFVSQSTIAKIRSRAPVRPGNALIVTINALSAIRSLKGMAA